MPCLPGFRRAVSTIALSLVAICAFAQDRGLLTVRARQLTGDTSFDVGRQYAVIIGIDRYKEWPGLRNAVSEAKSVKSVLAARYFIDEFIELYDGSATASAIRKVFTEDLPRKLNKEDSLFVFFAGHGHLDASSTGFWIASDGVRDVLDQRGWIANQQIRNYLATFKAIRILVVADACFSGDFVNVSRGAGPTVDSAYFSKALKLTARQVLTSGASETVPDESEFGRYLLTTLERNEDPILDPFSMYDRIRKSVTKTVPLFGTIPGNEAGATFAFFLKPGYGGISISVLSGGSVEVDGKAVGSASPGKPLTVPELSAGSHEVRIRYGASEESRTVTVRAGETSSEAFSWKPLAAGRLAVSAQADARVLVDGVIVGSVAGGRMLEVAGVAVGERVVTLQYVDNQEDRRVSIYPDTLNAISFSYRMQSSASVSFLGFPDGAVVFSAGRELGKISGGAFVAKDLVPGPRDFSVYYERWSAPYKVAIEIDARASNAATFAGARIVAVSLPVGVTVSVDGKAIVKGEGLRDSYDLGPFPAGEHSIGFTGEGYEGQSSVIVVKPGVEARVAAKLAKKPSPAGTSKPAAAAAGPSGAGATAPARSGKLRLTNDTGLKDGFEARLRREGGDSPLVFAWDEELSLPEGRYVLEARRSGDPEWAFSSSFDVVPGGARTQSVPQFGYSVAWRVADLELKRQAAALGVESALKAKKTRLAVSKVGAAAGLASLAVATFGFVDTAIAYPEYNAATDVDAAEALHERVSLDLYLWIGGSIATVAFSVPWSVRFFGNGKLARAEDALQAIEDELAALRKPQ